MKASTVAKQKNNRLRKRYPLLWWGGLIEPVTAEQVEEKRRFHIAKQAESEERWVKFHADVLRRAHEYMTIVIEAVDEDWRTLQPMFDQLRKYPAAPVYASTFWWRKLLEYAPAEAPRLCPNKQFHEAWGALSAHRQCPTCKVALNYVPKPTPPRQLIIEGIL